MIIIIDHLWATTSVQVAAALVSVAGRIYKMELLICYPTPHFLIHYPSPRLLVANQIYRAQYTLLFNLYSRWQCWIHVFPKVISWKLTQTLSAGTQLLKSFFPLVNHQALTLWNWCYSFLPWCGNKYPLYPPFLSPLLFISYTSFTINILTLNAILSGLRAFYCIKFRIKNLHLYTSKISIIHETSHGA